LAEWVEARIVSSSCHSNFKQKPDLKSHGTMFNIAPRVSSSYRDCKVPLLLVTMFGDFAQGQRHAQLAIKSTVHLDCSASGQNMESQCMHAASCMLHKAFATKNLCISSQAAIAQSRPARLVHYVTAMKHALMYAADLVGSELCRWTHVWLERTCPGSQGTRYLFDWLCCRARRYSTCICELLLLLHSSFPSILFNRHAQYSSLCK